MRKKERKERDMDTLIDLASLVITESILLLVAFGSIALNKLAIAIENLKNKSKENSYVPNQQDSVESEKINKLEKFIEDNYSYQK